MQILIKAIFEQYRLLQYVIGPKYKVFDQLELYIP